MSSRQTRPDPDGTPGRPAAGAGSNTPQPRGGSSVRRAVTLGPVAADPGGTLVPAAPRSTGGAAPSAPDPAPAAGPAPAPDTPSHPGTTSHPETSSAPVTAATARLEPAASGTAEAAAASEEPTLPGNGPAAAGEAPAAPGTTTGEATGGATREAKHENTRENTRRAAAGTVLAAEEPPSGPSRKPLLAAAGLVGVVLLAVPLVAWAASGSGDKDDHVSTAANTADRVTAPPSTAPHTTPAPRKPTASPTAKPTKKPAVRTKAVAPKPPAPPSPAPKPTASKKVTTYLGPGPQMPGDDKTASAAVLRLTAREPGRHICYRVYVATFGWQPAVCDGGVAGSETDARSIKAIQIAVAGTNGTSATAYIQAKGWMDKPWVTVEDGADLTLGEAKQDAPNISGFGISVGRAQGTVCQTTYSRGGPWQSMACDTPETSNNYIFGGTMDVTRWLDAVRFTV